ncbi:MAG: glycosyltransferase [Candidatus Brocadiaceae bacterium]|nr:glycosyltransferase [Candidatus Brocadiaceae bacterium]
MESLEINLKEGERLFAEGKILEAKQLFIALIDKGQNCREAYNNLGVIEFQQNDKKSSIEYFTKALEIDPFYKDAIMNYADLLRSMNQLSIAKPIVEKVAERYQDDEELINLLNSISSPKLVRTKIAIVCQPGMESFLGDIVGFLKNGHEVKVCYSINIQEIDTTIKWADIVWLEWANELTINLTNHPENILKDKHTICRLHSYETFAGFAGKVNWQNINDLIFVAEHIKDIVIQQVPMLPQIVNSIHVIPNGINMDRFSFKERAKGKNLAFVGNINYKKGPMLLLHAFRELVQMDSEYKLFVAGTFQDTRYQLYFLQMMQEMELGKNVQFDGWIKDINAWLEDKQYIVCSSVLEGHPVGIMEAMARGLKPLIHNFVGAKGIYPDKYIWNTIPEFVSMATEDNYDPAEYRNFIESNYSLDKQSESIDTIISQMSKGDINHLDSVDKKISELEVCT